MSINVKPGTGLIEEGDNNIASMKRIICSNDIDLVINPYWKETRKSAISAIIVEKYFCTYHFTN